MTNTGMNILVLTDEQLTLLGALTGVGGSVMLSMSEQAKDGRVEEMTQKMTRMAITNAALANRHEKLMREVINVLNQAQRDLLERRKEAATHGIEDTTP